MNEQEPVRVWRGGEAGFALVLAILALMLLTFLGLTLATTSSTELQIATNFRWSQQALVNAEAGLEAGKLILSNVANPVTNWSTVLPANRAGTWASGLAPTPVEVGAGRDFAPAPCGGRGNGANSMGYGLVLKDPVNCAAPPLSGGPGNRCQDISSFLGQAINGSFTLWVRRQLLVNNNGQFYDDPAPPNNFPNAAVLTVEGVAPYVGASTAFSRANQAVRVLEITFALSTSASGPPCQSMRGQEGGAPSGENFDPCSLLSAGPGGSLATVFGGGGGTLTSTGAQ
ncbi:MAG TPA: pilus assembly PilX N-terminal domain-containing protein [Vicinamibacteria bacterium]|nr:pilus assembly PilX N-terminal domain-containing protein [Vicinamibacteria bacterium]